MRDREWSFDNGFRTKFGNICKNKRHRYIKHQEATIECKTLLDFLREAEALASFNSVNHDHIGLDLTTSYLNLSTNKKNFHKLWVKKMHSPSCFLSEDIQFNFMILVAKVLYHETFHSIKTILKTNPKFKTLEIFERIKDIWKLLNFGSYLSIIKILKNDFMSHKKLPQLFRLTNLSSLILHDSKLSLDKKTTVSKRNFFSVLKTCRLTRFEYHEVDVYTRYPLKIVGLIKKEEALKMKDNKFWILYNIGITSTSIMISYITLAKDINILKLFLSKVARYLPSVKVIACPYSLFKKGEIISTKQK